MITVKQELRVYGMPGGALELRLTDLYDLQEPGVTWGEPLEAFMDNHSDLWGSRDSRLHCRSFGASSVYAQHLISYLVLWASQLVLYCLLLANR